MTEEWILATYRRCLDAVRSAPRPEGTAAGEFPDPLPNLDDILNPAGRP